MNAADLLSEFLVHQGVRHAFGVGGANIEDLFRAIQRRRPALRAVLCKHEHAAGTAADACARVGGGLGVVLATSGGGALNLVHAIAEARASRVPLLALVGEPPQAQQGRGAFQDTSGRAGSVDALAVFRALTPECTRIAEARELLPWMERLASLPASAWQGPRVLLLPKDVQQAQIEPPPGFLQGLPQPQLQSPPAGAAARGALVQLLRAGPVTVIAGSEVARAGAGRALTRLALALDARVAVAPDARDAFANDDPRFLGVVGAMGHARASSAVAQAHTILLVGTRLPLLERLGLEASLAAKPVVCVGREAPFVPHAALLECGERLAQELEALADELERGQPPRLTAAAAAHVDPAVASGSSSTVQAVLEALSKSLPDDAVVLVDAGNAGASAVHYVRAPRGGRWLLALGMAGMGYSFGGAIGAAFASGQRVFVVAGDGAFFLHGLEVHTAVEHDLPITYLVLDNAAHGMCLVRERLLLGESSGYNVFRRSQLGAGLAAMFPGLAARDCTTAEEVAQALEQGRGHQGPCFVSVQLADVEIPPFAAFQAARARGATTVER